VVSITARIVTVYDRMLTQIVLQISQRKITLIFLLRQSMSKANKQEQNRPDEHREP